MWNQTQTVNRRRHERFATLPMYTAVSVRRADRPAELLEGHAYDISEGGIRFELDSPVSPGSAITMRIALPGWLGVRPDHAPLATELPGVEVLANVIWVDQDPDPGPARMAAVFTAFLDAADRDRLFETLAGGALRRAA